MPRVSQNKTFLNSGKSPANAVAFKPSIENVLVLANQTNPFVPPQTSFTPTITPTMTVTPTSVYYFYTLTSCDGDTSKLGRSITSGLTGVYNFENTCYLTSPWFGPTYDYDLDTGTTVSGGCDNVVCLPPTPSPTTTPTLTPTPTTFCCKTCYLVNDTALYNNITYQLTNCDGSNSFYTIETNYSTATTCCVSAVFYSGQTSGFTNPTGITYSNDCSCVNPSPTPTRTQTKTPTQTPTVTPTSGLTPTPTQTSTKTPTPTRTPTRTVTSTVTPTSGLTSTPTPTPSITPTLTTTTTQTPTTTSTPTQTSTSTPTPTPSGVPQLGILNTFTEPGFLTLDSVSDSNLIFAFGQTGSTATTFVYTAQTPYSSVTSFSGITGGTSVTSEITNTHIYKAPVNTQFIEVIDISAYTSTTLSISGFSGINQSFLSSYDSSTNKVAILAEDGYSVLSIDTTNNSIAETALISGNTGGAGYKGGITTDGAGNFYVVGDSGQLSVIDSANDTLLNTYSISGANDYQKITYDSVNLNLFIFSKDFIYIYDTSGSYLDRTDISSYSANNDSGQASIVYNPDNQRVYVAFVNASNALVVLKIKTNDYTVESDKTNYGFTIGSNVRLKYNSSVGVLLTINNSSFYLLQP